MKTMTEAQSEVAKKKPENDHQVDHNIDRHPDEPVVEMRAGRDSHLKNVDTNASQAQLSRGYHTNNTKSSAHQGTSAREWGKEACVVDGLGE